jgi:hypothetical protein
VAASEGTVELAVGCDTLKIWWIRWLLFLGVASGCAELRENLHQPGRLPTAEEQCAFQGGMWSANVCHTKGGQ